MKKIVSQFKDIPENTYKYFKKVVYTRDFYLNLIFLLLVFVIFYINTFHESYPDEFDNILGGKLILQGLLPYIGFFSHHGPVPYFLASFIELFTGPSFVKFRIFYSVFLAAFIFWSFYYLRSRFGISQTKFYGYFIVLLAITSTYFWGHMLVADSLAAFLILPVFALLFILGIYKKELTTRDLVVISILSSLALLTAVTFIYVIFILYAYTGYLVLSQNRIKIFSKNMLSTISILASPFILFTLYLILTGSLSDYVTQSLVFNQKYYIYNYPGLTSHLNPVRYAIVIAYRFYFSFTGLLHQVPSFNFGFPFNITLALANTALAIYLLSKRKFVMTLVLFGVLVFANVRSSPIDSKEEDYQSAVYIIVSLLNICFTLFLLYKELNEKDLIFGKKIIYTFLLLLLGTYSLFTSIFVFQKFAEKAYNKYMGLASLIYDRPEVAQYLNQVIDPGEAIWYGPLEFKEMLYSKGSIPSKFHILIPGIGRSEELQKEMLASYQANPPKLIWFNKRFSVLGQPPVQFAPFFTKFLNKNYITVYEYSKGENSYSSIVSIDLNRDFETMLYIRKDSVNEKISKLVTANILRKSN